MKPARCLLVFVVLLFLFEGEAQAQSVKRNRLYFITPGEIYPDLDGNHIQAHGGGVLKIKNTYYWYGEQRGKGLDGHYRYVSCYSSSDLMNWRFLGNALKMSAPDSLSSNWVLERPKVFYNVKTKKYVMYFHIDMPDKQTHKYKLAEVGIATSDEPYGEFSYVRRFRPLNHESRDIGQFIDDDGSAYLIFEDRPNGFHIAKLSDDYMDVEKDIALIPAHLEGGAIVHYKGLYYCIGSGLTGWSPNPDKYATASALEGPWSEFKDIAPPEKNTYGSQSTMLLKVTGTKATSVIFMGDIWNPQSQFDSRYLWMPLEIGDGRLRLPEPKPWSINVATGEVDRNKNTVRNEDTKTEQIPLFEESDVFVGGQDDINTYRIPSLICTKKGTVLAFCEGRRDKSQDGTPTHLVLKRSLLNTAPMVPPEHKVTESRSRQRNMTWQPMQTLILNVNGDAYMNPVPVIDSGDGTIILLVNRCSNWGDAENAGKGVTEVWLLKSKDEGANWTKPVNITTCVGNIALGPGVGIQMKNGRLVAPVYDGIIFSDDHGKTWKAGNKTPALVNECQVVELTNGNLMLNTRGYPYRIVTLSNDKGSSWEEPKKDLALTDSKLWGGCQASLIRYTRQDEGYDKNRLLFSNPADTLFRFAMTVRMSYDEGKTWPVAKVINKGTGAYSSMTAFPDGSIGIIYETGNNNKDIIEYDARLSFARFNLEWLTNGEDHFPPAH